MAKKKSAVQSDYPPRNKKHPWDVWLDGEWHMLTHGVDFQVPVTNMAIQALTYCRNHGMKVETRIQADGKRLALRKVASATKAPEAPKATMKKATKPCREKNTTNA